MSDEEFMRAAIKDARKNGRGFGAVVVKDGKILSKAGSKPKKDKRYHAETQAIFKLGQDLKGCVLYSTCEPCAMCFYMAWITGISEIIYGATIKDSIGVGTDEINISVKELNEKGGNRLKLKGGVLREECLDLLGEADV